MMTSIYRVFLATALASFASISLTAHAKGAKWQTPAIPYGPIHPLPRAAVQPNRNRVYKALFDVTTKIANPSQPAPGLVHVARAVNVFVSAGVPLKHLKFEVIIHGPTTAAVLNNESYKRKFGVNNPNILLIQDLKKAGVHVDVCGQALADLKFPHSWVQKDVRIDLSALATVVMYGDMGYAYMAQ